jgi:hypothetical protein
MNNVIACIAFATSGIGSESTSASTGMAKAFLASLEIDLTSATSGLQCKTYTFLLAVSMGLLLSFRGDMALVDR